MCYEKTLHRNSSGPTYVVVRTGNAISQRYSAFFYVQNKRYLVWWGTRIFYCISLGAFRCTEGRQSARATLQSPRECGRDAWGVSGTAGLVRRWSDGSVCCLYRRRFTPIFAPPRSRPATPPGPLRKKRTQLSSWCGVAWWRGSALQLPRRSACSLHAAELAVGLLS